MNNIIWASKCSGQSWYIHYGSYATAWSKNWTTIFCIILQVKLKEATTGMYTLAATVILVVSYGTTSC